MRVRMLATAVASIAALALTPVGAAQAQSASSGRCPYPVNNPNLSANVAPGIVVAGGKVRIGGYLTRNSCGIPFQRLGLYTRSRPGAYSYRAVTTAGASGQYFFDLFPAGALDAIVIFSGDRAYGRAVSNKVHVTVLPRG